MEREREKKRKREGEKERAHFKESSSSSSRIIVLTVPFDIWSVTIATRIGRALALFVTRAHEKDENEGKCRCDKELGAVTGRMRRSRSKAA